MTDENKPNKTPKSIDWDKERAEWLAGSETLNQFRLRKGFSAKWFYHKVEQLDWEGARQRIAKKALQKIETAGANSIAKEFENNERLWRAVEAQAARILNQQIKDQNLDPVALAALSQAIERALKNRRLILGQSTENKRVEGEISNTHTGQIDVRHAMVDLMDRFRRRDPSIIDPLALEGEATENEQEE